MTQCDPAWAQSSRPCANVWRPSAQALAPGKATQPDLQVCPAWGWLVVGRAYVLLSLEACLWLWDLVPAPHCPLPVCLRQDQCSAWWLCSQSVWDILAPARAGPQSHPPACPVSSFSLDSVARDRRELWRFLMQNLSLPNSTAQALLAARVDPSEVRWGSPITPGPSGESTASVPEFLSGLRTLC